MRECNGLGSLEGSQVTVAVAIANAICENSEHVLVESSIDFRKTSSGFRQR